MDERLYYYTDQNNQPQGPFTISQLADKHITVNTFVWAEGMRNWTPAGQVTGFSDIVVRCPVPPPFHPEVPIFCKGTPYSSSPQNSSPVKRQKVWLVSISVLVGIFFLTGIGYIVYTGMDGKKEVAQRAEDGDSEDYADTGVADTVYVIPPEAGVHSLKGYIGDSPVELEINVTDNGDGKPCDIEGTLTYADGGYVRGVEGYWTRDGRFYLQEYYSKSIETGMLEGDWWGNTMNGTFIRSNDKKEMSFSLEE